MIRKRYLEGFAELKTKKARVEYADTLIKNLTERLENGRIPTDDEEKVAYIDELEYHTAAEMYGRKRQSNKNIRIYASEYITLIKSKKQKELSNPIVGRFVN